MATAEQKTAARTEVQTAIREGRMCRPTACEACGVTPNTDAYRKRRSGIVFHHHDYDKPLDVIPLCLRCHTLVHRGALAEPRTGRIYPRWTGRDRWSADTFVEIVLTALAQGKSRAAFMSHADFLAIKTAIEAVGGVEYVMAGEVPSWDARWAEHGRRRRAVVERLEAWRLRAMPKSQAAASTEAGEAA